MGAARAAKGAARQALAATSIRRAELPAVGKTDSQEGQLRAAAILTASVPFLLESEHRGPFDELAEVVKHCLKVDVVKRS